MRVHLSRTCDKEFLFLSHARGNWICFFHSSKPSLSLSLSQQQTRLWLRSNWVIKKTFWLCCLLFLEFWITPIRILMDLWLIHIQSITSLVVWQEFFPTARSLIAFFQVTWRQTINRFLSAIVDRFSAKTLIEPSVIKGWLYPIKDLLLTWQVSIIL